MGPIAGQFDAPRLPALSGHARQLVVFLHGYGANGHDLIEIGRAWQRLFPDTAFVAPHAPDLCAGLAGGRQWFELTFRDPGEFWRGVAYAHPGLDALLDAELARCELPGARLALVGFSQGAMMALHTGLRRPTAPAAIVGYSGLLVTPPGQTPASMAKDITARPPVLLVHGDQDEIIPVEALQFSADGLADLGVPAQIHRSKGLAHGIDQDGLRLGAAFLAKAFQTLGTMADSGQ